MEHKDETAFIPGIPSTSTLISDKGPVVPCMQTGFGYIEINGETYTHDVVIHANGKISKRDKKKSKRLRDDYGHTPLSGPELDFIPGEKPDIIYIGTGQYGSLPLTPDTGPVLDSYKTVVQMTPEVISRLKDEKRRYIAILHVTC